MEQNQYGTRPIFNEADRQKADIIRESRWCRFSELSSGELRDLAVVWSFYSGKIEGNTYTYVETETLLKDDISATKKYEDAVMLKNLYNAFISVIESIRKQGPLTVDARTVMTVHSMISDKLLRDEHRGALRVMPVRISGTTYTPPADQQVIEETFHAILQGQHSYDDPLERAVYLHCNLARLQPFADGPPTTSRAQCSSRHGHSRGAKEEGAANKRTSRLIEAITLMNGDIVPVYSSDAADIAAYRQGLVHYYETGDFSAYKDYFLDRQLRRVLSILPESEQNVRNRIGNLLHTDMD